MLTLVKLQLVFCLFLTYISQLTADSFMSGRLKPLTTETPSVADTREGMFVKNAAKNDQVFRCLSSLWYITHNEEHTWDFIKGRNPKDFINKVTVKKMVGNVRAVADSFDIPALYFAQDVCRKHYHGTWKCIDCAKHLYNQVFREFLQFVYLGPRKYNSGVRYIQKDCAQFKKIHFGTCEMTLALLLFCYSSHKNGLLYQEKAKCFGYCEFGSSRGRDSRDLMLTSFDSNKLFQACHNKSGIDMRIFRHGEKDLDYLRKLQFDKVCPGVTKLPYLL